MEYEAVAPFDWTTADKISKRNFVKGELWLGTLHKLAPLEADNLENKYVEAKAKLADGSFESLAKFFEVGQALFHRVADLVGGEKFLEMESIAEVIATYQTAGEVQAHILLYLDNPDGPLLPPRRSSRLD